MAEMTKAPPPRPVTSDVPRRRTRKACLTCQRKKLKCNGLHPCVACVSRNNTCTYANRSPDMSRSQMSNQNQNQNQNQASNFTSYPTRRTSEGFTYSPTSTPRRGTTASDTNATSVGSVAGNLAPRPLEQQFCGGEGQFGAQVPGTNIIGASPELPTNNTASNQSTYAKGSGTQGAGAGHGQREKEGAEVNRKRKDISREGSDGNEGELLNEQSRLLNDGKGRLLYLGDSASLSYLDTIRRLVENTLGPSDFTTDPHRSKLLEGSIRVERKPTHVLPDREAAEFLIESFFSNTVGILYIIDRVACAREVAVIYENPLQVEQSRLSILNLLFAVGLQMTRTSTAHSFRESQILKRLDAGAVNRAELFYLNATYLNDPIQGFEDGDITSIQALLLITVFMLTVAKRNAAWAYFGMAVRSAYALGLHRKETSLAFAPLEQRLRRNIWKSLCIIDCFISAMLGRPNGISTRDALDSLSAAGEDDPEQEDSVEVAALTASVTASRLIGDILSYVYAERKISVKLAHHLSSKFQSWKAALPPILHWQNISLPNQDPRTTLAQLHVNLSYFHGIILLTRPFLLQRIGDLMRADKGDGGMLGPPKMMERTKETSSASAEPFPPACVRSAVYSIDAVQNALLKRALPRRDPFVIYWLFTAALIVFSNEFVTVCSDVDTSQAMQTALSLHQYLGEVDTLARRYSQILAAFHEAIAKRETGTSAGSPIASRASNENILNAFFGGVADQNNLNTQPVSARSVGRPDHRPMENATTNADNPSTTAAMQGAADSHSYFQWPLSMQGSAMAGQMGMGGESEGMMGAGAGTGISPSDYSLDFDAFLSSVTQDPAYVQDLWMPLYGTMDAT